jgi:hypothetical protein
MNEIYQNSENLRINRFWTQADACASSVFRKSMEQIEPEKGSGNYFKVYPVPSSDYVFINYSFNEEVQYPKLKVYDINGRLLLNRGIDKKVGQILLDKNDLQAAGVYLCQIVAEGKILFSNKIIFTE